nr:hypothetical protein [Candidatus Freyarchaeota archaeon]
MTKFSEVEKKCALCREESTQRIFTSTNAFGSLDLDMRPPEMERSTINLWIETCPSCGYCVSDISKRIEKASEVVRGNTYQQQLNNPEFPKLANKFLCFSLILESVDNYAGAGWSSVYAAWACDDAGSSALKEASKNGSIERFTNAAKKCRIRAATLFQKARENDQSFAEEVGVEEALMVDLPRRAGRFESALRICEEGLKKKPKKNNL